jgi:hypothetical protein
MTQFCITRFHTNGVVGWFTDRSKARCQHLYGKHPCQHILLTEATTARTKERGVA